MPHLVALGIFGFSVQFHPSAVEVIQRRLTGEVLPPRNAFWFHLGENLTEENDTSVPQIHYDEIVDPIDPFLFPLIF